jgi:hypothetical protein
VFRYPVKERIVFLYSIASIQNQTPTQPPFQLVPQAVVRKKVTDRVKKKTALRLHLVLTVKNKWSFTSTLPHPCYATEQFYSLLYAVRSITVKSAFNLTKKVKYFHRLAVNFLTLNTNIKFVLEQAKVSQRGSRVIAIRFL